MLFVSGYFHIVAIFLAFVTDNSYPGLKKAIRGTNVTSLPPVIQYKKSEIILGENPIREKNKRLCFYFFYFF